MGSNGDADIRSVLQEKSVPGNIEVLGDTVSHLSLVHAIQFIQTKLGAAGKHRDLVRKNLGLPATVFDRLDRHLSLYFGVVFDGPDIVNTMRIFCVHYLIVKPLRTTVELAWQIFPDNDRRSIIIGKPTTRWQVSLLDALGMMCAYKPPRNWLSTTPTIQRQDLSAKLHSAFTRQHYRGHGGGISHSERLGTWIPGVKGLVSLLLVGTAPVVLLLPFTAGRDPLSFSLCQGGGNAGVRGSRCGRVR